MIETPHPVSDNKTLMRIPAILDYSLTRHAFGKMSAGEKIYIPER